jgi:hypothetical protein
MAWTEGIEAAFMSDDVAEATSLIDIVATLPPGVIPPYCRATVSRSKARLAAIEGDEERAAAEFHTAEQTFEELGYAYWLARTRLEHATRLAGSGRSAEAARYAELALATFTELGAGVWAERARAVTAVPLEPVNLTAPEQPVSTT